MFETPARTSAPRAAPTAPPLSARAVAVALRARLPEVPAGKLHRLLYYCQGHHLAAFGVPLFTENVSAGDAGPVVEGLRRAEEQAGGPSTHRPGTDLDEAQLNTVGYVLSRYGALTGHDLDNLARAEEPWKRADDGRHPDGAALIRAEWMTRYFRADGRPGDRADDAFFESPAVRQWLDDAGRHREEPTGWDESAEIAARLAALRAEPAAGA